MQLTSYCSQVYPIQESYPNELVVSHSSIGFVDDGFLASLLEMNPENKADNKLCAFYSDNVIAEHEAFQVVIYGFRFALDFKTQQMRLWLIGWFTHQ